MSKYVIKEKTIGYGYRVVEAKSEEEALKVIPTYGEIVLVDTGHYENEDVKELKGEAYLFCNQNHFEVVKDKDEFIKEWERENGWKPYLENIQDTAKKGGKR